MVFRVDRSNDCKHRITPVHIFSGIPGSIGKGILIFIAYNQSPGTGQAKNYLNYMYMYLQIILNNNFTDVHVLRLNAIIINMWNNQHKKKQNVSSGNSLN